MADMLILHRVEHGDFVGDELHQVFVRRDNRHSRALGLGLAGLSRHQVIRLIALLFQRMGLEGDRSLAHQRELRAQVLRWLRPLGFVFREHVIPERVGGFVEHAGKVGRAIVTLEILEQLPEHIAEPGHGPDGQAVRGPGQRRQGVISAENIGAGINQVEMAVSIDRGARHGLILR